MNKNLIASLSSDGLKMVNQQKIIMGVLAVVTLGLSACATKPMNYSYTNDKPLIVNGIPSYYIVQQGDTLSRISQRYGLDYRQVGLLNNLDRHYTIYTGQRLQLLSSEMLAQAKQLPTSQPIQQYPVNTTSSYNAYTPSYVPPQTLSQPLPTPVQPTTPRPATSNKAWLPPVSGNVIRGYNEASGSKGIWYGGQVGTAVVASRAGTVLYAGDKLKEYGNLVMIRHDNDYISAYAHLERFSVKEGQVVQAGQQVGSMGTPATLRQPALEFQVRYKGLPIDPKNLLN